MFKMLGFGDLNSTEAWTVMLAAIALALLVGWLLDLVAAHIGFGILGNGFITLLGIAVGLVMYRNYMGEITLHNLTMVIAAATASVVLHLYVLIFLRRTLKL